MIVLCDVSAWELHRTPPIVASVELKPEELVASGWSGPLAVLGVHDLRSNTREAERLVCSRLLFDLKGVSLPVHVMVEPGSSFHHSELIHVHQIPRDLPTGELMPLGGGLYALSPALSLAVHNQCRTPVQIAKMMFEGCGLFALCPQNDRTRLAQRLLLEAGMLSEGNISPDQRIYSYSDAAGKRVSFLDWEGEPLPWTPCFTKRGALSNIWKRPPLTNVEELEVTLSRLSGLRYLDRARHAVDLVFDGAASPAEAQAALLFCAPHTCGGEGWPNPQLNQRVEFTQEARRLASTSFAVADLIWPEHGSILEVNGQGFHADGGGFLIQTGRTPALESLGYAVGEITPAQMADPVMLETMTTVLSKKLGFAAQERTGRFIRRRESLREELFGRSFEPSWTGCRRLKNK